MSFEMPILGVLGGMGPSATALFYEMLIEECQLQLGARKQSEYPHILIYNLPVADIIDGQNLHDLETCKCIVDTLRAGLSTLQQAGATTIAIPCNTVHIFYDEIVDGFSNVEVLDIVNVTVDEVLEKGHQHVCVFGTVSTIRSRLYEEQLEFREISVSKPNDTDCRRIAEIIDRVISGHNNRGKSDFASDRRLLTSVANRLAINNGCTALILGCTDLSHLLADRERVASIEKLDSLKALAKASIRQIRLQTAKMGRHLTTVPR